MEMVRTGAGFDDPRRIMGNKPATPATNGNGKLVKAF